MNMPAPTPTGAELVGRIRQRACELGFTHTSRFAAPLAPKNPTTWLRMLESVDRPNATTVARIEALLAGQEVPPPRYARARAPRGAHGALGGSGQARLDPAKVPPPIQRDPCTWCGTRADFGCKHQPATTPEAFA